MLLHSALAVTDIKAHHAQAAARLQLLPHIHGLTLQSEQTLGAQCAIQPAYVASMVCEHPQGWSLGRGFILFLRHWIVSELLLDQQSFWSGW